MSRTTITVISDHLLVEPVGMDKIWSLTRRLEIPLDAVRGATFDPGMRDEPKGWRGPGPHLPGTLSGTFHADGSRQFWNVSGHDRTVVVTLDPSQRYERRRHRVGPAADDRRLNGAVGTR